MRLLLALLLCALPALAQEDAEEEAPATLRPGSDSPEAQHPEKRAADGSRRRAQAFLIPMDERAKAATARVAQAVEGVLAGTAHYEVVDLGKALSVESSPEHAALAAEGRKLVAEGNTAFASRNYAEAAGKYKAGIKALEKGLAGVTASEYAEAWLRLAASQHLLGDSKSARDSFAAVARFDPQQKLQARTIDDSVELPLQGARADVEAAPAGIVEVESRPAGANVIVDGQARGQAPMRLEVVAGRHLIRLARAGFYPHADLLEVGSRKPSTLSAALTPTPTAAGLNQVIAGAAEEVSRGSAGANVAKLADSFQLDRVLIGSVTSHDRKMSVLLALVDARKQKLIARQSLLLTADGTDEDQIELETASAGRKIVAQDSGGEEPVARAVAAPDRKPAAPQAPASDEDPGLVKRERRVAIPSASASSAATSPAAEPPAPAASGAASGAAQGAVAAEPPSSADKPAPQSTDENKRKKKKGKGLKGKTGTEGWDEE